MCDWYLIFFFFFLVKRAGRHFGFFKRAGRHEKGAGRRALQKKPRQNTEYYCPTGCPFQTGVYLNTVCTHFSHSLFAPTNLEQVFGGVDHSLHLSSLVHLDTEDSALDCPYIPAWCCHPSSFPSRVCCAAWLNHHWCTRSRSFDSLAIAILLFLLHNWQIMPFGHITPVRMVVCRLMV